MQFDNLLFPWVLLDTWLKDNCQRTGFLGNILIHTQLSIIRGLVMPTAFVLINTEIGSESDVLKELKKVEGVEEASAVYGVYDIVARVKADTMDKLKEIVTWRIRRLDKVRSTLTMIVVEDRS
jgi:DNA-binding Lrp family transcriptional regulator